MTPSPSYDSEILFSFVVIVFWLVTIVLDLVCLLSLRRSRIEATARVLWVVWIVLAPLIGAITYFIVQPTPVDERISQRDGPFREPGRQRQHWTENIQR